LVGKGDCAIRYYEINDDPPFVHYINTYTTSEPQRAFAFMPKRGIDSVKNEINRIYKLTTKGIVDILQFFVPRKSDVFQIDLYPDTRSKEPALTAEQFIDGKDAPPKLMAVNPEAAQAKPKVTVAKKANILDKLPNSESVIQPQQYSAPQPASSAPRRGPEVDEDMGIVPISKPPPRQQYREPSPPPQQTEAIAIKNRLAKSRAAERDEGPGGGRTPGQNRAAAELERIKREQNRSAVNTEAPNTTPIGGSRSISNGEAGAFSDDIEKIKSVLRQHERRIRLLEEQLADANMSNAYNI